MGRIMYAHFEVHLGSNKIPSDYHWGDPMDRRMAIFIACAIHADMVVSCHQLHAMLMRSFVDGTTSMCNWMGMDLFQRRSSCPITPPQARPNRPLPKARRRPRWVFLFVWFWIQFFYDCKLFFISSKKVSAVSPWLARSKWSLYLFNTKSLLQKFAPRHVQRR